tara:strand:+ start:14151 stop:15437 length:1287 start_codon:yes stop_codon:yes gene_type:complete
MIKKKVLNNISWLVLDKFATLLLGLIVIVKVANYYGPTDYGLYQYAISINLILGVIVLFVDGRVVKKLYPEIDHGIVIYNTTIAKVILSFISLLIGLTILLFIGEDSKFNIIYIILLINNIVLNLAFGLQNYFEYNLKSKNVVLASNTANLISALFQLLAVSLNFSIITIAVIIFISSIIKLIILIFQFNRIYSLNIYKTFNSSLIINIIRESVPLAIAATAATIYSRIDQVMIGSMLSIDEVGIYSISVQMVAVVAMVISPIQVSIFPRMLKWYNSNREYYYLKYQALTRVISWISVIGIFLSFVIAPIFFDIFFDDSFSNSVNVFKIHVIGTFFMYNAILRSSHFTLTKGTNILMISQIIAVFVNIGLNFILIPIIGIYGAAVATIITQFSSLFISNLFFKNGREVFKIQLKALNPIYIFSDLRIK